MKHVLTYHEGYLALHKPLEVTADAVTVLAVTRIGDEYRWDYVLANSVNQHIVMKPGRKA